MIMSMLIRQGSLSACILWLLLDGLVVVVKAFSVYRQTCWVSQPFPRKRIFSILPIDSLTDCEIRQRKDPNSFSRRWSSSQAATGQSPYEEGDVGITRHNGEGDPQSFFSLYYRIYNKNKIDTNNAQLPLVVVHGGP